MRSAIRVLLYGGIASFVLGFSKAHAWAHDYDFTGSGRLVWALAFIALLAVAAYGFGFPEMRRSRRASQLGALAVSGTGTLAISTVQLLTGDALLPRFVVFGSAAAVVPLCSLCGRLADRYLRTKEERDRLVVVARLADRTYLSDDLARSPERTADVVGEMDPEAAADGTGTQLLDLARHTNATVVVLCRDALADERVIAQAALLHEGGVRIRTIPMFFEQWIGKVPLSELERTSLLFDIGEVHTRGYAPLKRLLDVLVCVPGLVALVFLTPGVAVANLFGNRGPVFFRQERVGKHGRTFSMLKFRTMRGGDGQGEWTMEGDPRVTPFGSLLRTSHLDELPQVLNIARGDLSVVGPRPEQPQYVEELARKLPHYDLRHLVRPGLTGWAQVKYGYAGDESDAVEKLQYEFFYLRHQNLLLDARIIGRTLRSVVGGQGTGR